MRKASFLAIAWASAGGVGLAALFAERSALSADLPPNCPSLFGSVYDTISGHPYNTFADAMGHLPKDEVAWANQAQARWEELHQLARSATSSEQRARVLIELDRFEQQLAAVGKARIDVAVSSVAQEAKSVIIALPEEPTAYKLLAMSWIPTTPKSIRIKAKTAASGIAKGFVPVDQSLSKAAATRDLAKYQQDVDQCLKSGDAVAIPLTRAGQTAVFRGGTAVWVDHPARNDRVVEILADPHGSAFVSDLDLLAIAHHSDHGDPAIKNTLVTKAYGEITVHDHEVISKVNRIFRGLDGVDKSKNQRSRSIVQHGAANRYPKSSLLASNSYPLTVYWPDGRIEVVVDETSLQQLFKDLRAAGYDAVENPAWGWGKH